MTDYPELDPDEQDAVRRSVERMLNEPESQSRPSEPKKVTADDVRDALNAFAEEQSVQRRKKTDLAKANARSEFLLTLFFGVIIISTSLALGFSIRDVLPASLTATFLLIVSIFVGSGIVLYGFVRMTMRFRIASSSQERPLRPVRPMEFYTVVSDTDVMVTKVRHGKVFTDEHESRSGKRATHRG
ncbi:hypothetical protein LR392_04665 [Arthrobacter sp. AK04]|uniref:hypothetical protein n=1 Tax=Arthrobacter sp. AK04 TaxID=2900048 RepID=UPI001E41D0D6|nr:hypothetical protein [Arthrobacter sp. AK04]MCD5341521.1 hypothetical protein [Arthrobacter sp. AK04]